MGAAACQEPLDLNVIVPSSEFKAERKELRFDIDVSSLLNDDMEFTLGSIENEARRLLAGLKYFRQNATQVNYPRTLHPPNTAFAAD